MNDAANQVDPIAAYVQPIRSVLFIDDKFPVFAEKSVADFEETDRAHALWKTCTERGWLCDIDNSSNWKSDAQLRRLAACDLLVLDFHLDGDNSIPALEIIEQLALSAAPNMVVVYTRDPDLDNVLLKAACWARGAKDIDPFIEMTEDLEKLEDLVEWSRQDLMAYISGRDDWVTTLDAACDHARLQRMDTSQYSILLEQKLRSDFKIEPAKEIRNIESIGSGNHRWFQCGNLFLVVTGKPVDQDLEQESDVLIGGLESAVRQWSPSWLACLVADSRRQVEVGAFRDDARLPEESLQRGLLGYISESDDKLERSRRSVEIATHLLSRRFNLATTTLGKQLLVTATSGRDIKLNEAEIIHLNAYLCSENFAYHYLRVGTVFRSQETDPEYWVCVTPACDMVPRKPNGDLNPWAAQLDPYRPMLALRLTVISEESKIRKALKEAHLGRHLFFWDRDRDTECPTSARCFQKTSDPNPMLEEMIAVDRARVSDDGRIQLHRCVCQSTDSENYALALQEIECTPVAQLRPPYAERIVHVVGGHVSRIGVDFVKYIP